MATRLLVLKILFLVLIARHSLLFAEALEEDEALEGEFNKANNESTIIEAASTIYAENEPATTSDPSETRQPNETEVPEASTTKLLINESIEKRAGDSRAETTDKPALIAELGLSTTLNLAAPQEAAATTASSLLAGSTAPPPPPMSQAELCYLSNGGSSLTLTVNEATEVGSIIGTIEVNGDPSLETGNVDLFVVAPEQVAAAAADPTPASPSKSTSRRILGKRHSPVPPPQPQALTTTPLIGLGSDHNSISDGGSFYSLLGAAQPAAPGPAAVRLIEGTKSLVLARKLDKEAQEDSIVINVGCSPRKAGTRHSSDSSTIPIKILVTDANDHAPEFLGQLPYIINISETAPINSIASRDIQAIDRDSAGPFSTIHYKVLEDPTAAAASGHHYASLLQFSNPLEPSLFVAGPLDYETLGPSFTVLVQASDHGEPEPLMATAQVQVNIIDFDDQNPKFLDDKYTLIMDESQQNLVGQNLQVLPRNLYAEDGDRGINAQIVYSFDTSTSGGGSGGDDPAQNIDRYLHLNPNSGEIRLIRLWPAKWASNSMTLVVRATQADNKDRYTLTTLTIARPSSIRTSTTTTSTTESPPVSLVAKAHGIEFTPDKLSVNVPENVAINAKIAWVKAKYLGQSQLTSPPTVDPPNANYNDSQAVDLVTTPGAPPKIRKTRVADQLQQKRPIIYQILDDSLDQFGINGLGEIFVRKALDYETRQEYKFRVLASYTKYSDICQVQVNVQNINDNKPKFTQPQYTFHLTESRLKTNGALIGSVQAHDLDLNDSIRYSILSGDQNSLALFDLNQVNGQLSLKPGIKQLNNITQCQLIVQATDTLAAPYHSHQARVNLQVSPQLLGRSINFESSESVGQDRAYSRNLITSSNQDNEHNHHQWSLAPFLGSSGRSSGGVVRAATLNEPASQRSSIATVMSSLQHMVRQVNFFDMPMSSTLLLSILLALLVCLLFILIISMSVSFFKRRSKLNRHRHHLATLRHAHLANHLHPSDRARYMQNSALSSIMSASLSAASNPSPINHSPIISSSPAAATLAATVDPAAATRRPNSATPAQASRAGSRQSQIQEATTKALSVNVQQAAQQQVSLISSLSSSHSRRSYKSSTDDNSSMLHCGHYSINGPNRATPVQGKPSLFSPRQSSEQQQRQATEAQSSIEAALKSLAKEANMASTNDDQSLESFKKRLVGEPTTCDKPQQQQQHIRVNNFHQTNELSVLTNSKPGIKAYRKLPINSLVRPAKHSNKVGPYPDERTRSQDSAIASGSDNNSSGSSSEHNLISSRGEGLMAMIRDSTTQGRVDMSEFRASQLTGAIQASGDDDLLVNEQYAALRPIRWPQGVMPSRVKKLTWDDELSINAGSPDNRLMLLKSPASAVINNGYAANEQHFLFSNPCSPALMSSQSNCSSYPADTLQRQPSQPAPLNQSHNSIMGNHQNNCFDYTIVQSSQFQVDRDSYPQQQHFPETANANNSNPSISSNHLLNSNLATNTSYLYNKQQQQRAMLVSPSQPHHHYNNHQDLIKQQQESQLMTTAVL